MKLVCRPRGQSQQIRESVLTAKIKQILKFTVRASRGIFTNKLILIEFNCVYKLRVNIITYIFLRKLLTTQFLMV